MEYLVDASKQKHVGAYWKLGKLHATLASASTDDEDKKKHLLTHGGAVQVEFVLTHDLKGLRYQILKGVNLKLVSNMPSKFNSHHYIKDVSKTDVEAITVFLLCLTGGAIIFSFTIVYRQVRRSVAADRNSGTLCAFVANMWLAITIVLRQKYKTADELTRAIDRDGNNSLSYYELVESFENLGLTNGTALLISEVLFLLLDDDRSGELSASELAASVSVSLSTRVQSSGNSSESSSLSSSAGVLSLAPSRLLRSPSPLDAPLLSTLPGRAGYCTGAQLRV